MKHFIRASLQRGDWLQSVGWYLLSCLIAVFFLLAFFGLLGLALGLLYRIARWASG